MKNVHIIPFLKSRQVAVFLAGDTKQLPQPSLALTTYSIKEQYEALMTFQVSVISLDESLILQLRFVITGKLPKGQFKLLANLRV